MAHYEQPPSNHGSAGAIIVEHKEWCTDPCPKSWVWRSLRSGVRAQASERHTVRVIPRNELGISAADLGVVAVALCARSVVVGLYCGGDRFESRDQFVEPVRAERVVRRRRQSVREGLDPLLGLTGRGR